MYHKNFFELAFLLKYKNIFISVVISDYQMINYISNDRINIYINNELNIIELEKDILIKNIIFAIIQTKENKKIKYLDI